MKRIKLQIFPDGRVQAETQGIKGKACTNYIKILEELLGAEVVDSSYTSEFYEQELVQDQIAIQQRVTGE